MLLDQEFEDSTSVGNRRRNDWSAPKIDASDYVLSARMEVMCDVVNLDANIVMGLRTRHCDQVKSGGRPLRRPKRYALTNHRSNRKLPLSEDGANDLSHTIDGALKVNPDVVVMHGWLAAQRLS
ncbi:MAG: hypothetical protein JNL93_08795 [Pelomonas sp.]|nr:hypothetical protein [Roseateles sp.]